jgi:hypothetical protein
MKAEDLLHVVAGTFIVVSVALSHFHHPYWLFFTVFVGLNLFQYGFSQVCPMTSIFRKFRLKSICEMNADQAK